MSRGWTSVSTRTGCASEPDCWIQENERACVITTAGRRFVYCVRHGRAIHGFTDDTGEDMEVMKRRRQEPKKDDFTPDFTPLSPMLQNIKLTIDAAIARSKAKP